MTGAATVAVAVSAVALGASAFYILLPKMIRPALRLALAVRYRFEITGTENIPKTGAVLFAANHVTWIDGFILAGLIPRRGKAMVNAALVNLPLLKQLTIRAGIIPVPYKGPRPSGWRSSPHASCWRAASASASSPKVRSRGWA